METKIIKTPFDQTQIIGTRYGLMIGLRQDIYQTRSLAMIGEWAPDETDMICSFLKLDDVALDIGAHVGSITIPMALKVGASGTVIAFEPQSAPFCCLCGNIALTNTLLQARPLRLAASDVCGPVDVPIVPLHCPVNAGGVRLNDPRYNEKMKYPTEQIRAITIDSLELPELDLIKIDVESMEHKVLTGAEKTVARCRPVVVAEALPFEMENVRRMQEFFRRHNYVTRIAVTPLWRADNARRCPENIFGGGVDINMVALPAERTMPVWMARLPEEMPADLYAEDKHEETVLPGPTG